MLSDDQISWIVVHLGGLFIDLFSGFFLFFDSTRLFGTLIVSSFHIMNAQLFSIGMFPYTMLVTTGIFYSNDWPKRLVRKLLKLETDSNGCSNLSPHCIYEKMDKENDENKKKTSNKEKKVVTLKQRQASFYHKFFAIFTLIYIGEQLFLPYSHFITKVNLLFLSLFLYYY